MERGGRIHSMDALRASAMLLLLPLHAATLIALNGHEGTWATIVFWGIHLFRLPVFFAMSGFFLVLALPRKGLRATAHTRMARIVVPLAIGLVTLVPLTLFLAHRTGLALTPEGNPHASPFDFELNFLWFLWYLLIVDAIGLCVYLAAPQLVRRAGAAFRELIVHPLAGILLLAVPTALTLWPAADWMPTPATDTFLPDPGTLAYYALFFALGSTLCAHHDLLAALSRNAWKWVACALAAVLPAGALFALHNASAYSSGGLVHGADVLLYSIAAWTTLLALIGFFHRYFGRPRPLLRYISDSSYWIYLSHMPAVVLLVALLGLTTLAIPAQLALVTLGALAVSLLTYALFVRYTAIGWVLNGRRTRGPRKWSPLSVQHLVAPAAAARQRP